MGSMTADGDSPRILVCDARPVMRTGLTAAVTELGATEETGIEQLVDAVTASNPDVLVAGLRIDDPDTFRTISLAKAACPDLEVLVVADGATVVDLREAVIAGVTSFLLASAPSREIRDATRATARGERVISPSIAMQLAGTWRQSATEVGASMLTSRELEVLQLLAEGLTNERIAERIGLSPRTVKTHVQNLLGKLDVPDRTGAVARGFRLGLIS